MIEYWHAGLTVASIQPKLLLLTKMVRVPGFVTLSSYVFLIVPETSFRWIDTTADGKQLQKIAFSSMCLSVISFFNLLPFLQEKSFLLGCPVSTCFKSICGKSCGKSCFLNLLLLVINCNKNYCQSCKIPLIRRGGGTVNDLL